MNIRCFILAFFLIFIVKNEFYGQIPISLVLLKICQMSKNDAIKFAGYNKEFILKLQF